MVSFKNSNNTINLTYIADRFGPKDMGATARSEIDTETTKDAQAQFERVQAMVKKEKMVNEPDIETSQKVFKFIN